MAPGHLLAKAYASHTLSAWGDRMWTFAIGLFLVQLTPGSLRLTAVYGIVVACTILLFCSSTGNWVDRAPRLRAAQVALAANNLTIALCAAGVCLLFVYRPRWEGTWAVAVAETAVIALAAVAALASETSKIIVQRDWVVVIAGGDNNQLANMNAVFRTIDQTTYVLAPTLVGAVMSFWKPAGAAVFLAAWNLLSVIFEYGLLRAIFRALPELAHKTAIDDDAPRSIGSDLPDPHEEVPAPPTTAPPTTAPATTAPPTTAPATTAPPKQILRSLAAWKHYFSHPVFPAAFGLAALYMTVLGFDSITQGYLYSQGVAEWLVGLLTGVGALTGLLGAVAFPSVRRRLGIERTGLSGFGLESFSLCFCVAAVFTPGSPFQWDYLWDPAPSNSTAEPTGNATATGAETGTNSAIADVTISLALFVTGIISARFALKESDSHQFCIFGPGEGLWLADLSVTQIIQEKVEEARRGSFSGVQSSMNMVMDLVKYGLVAGLPGPQTFGYLVVASFLFVCLGWLSFGIYSRRQRGHLLPHLESLVPCLRKAESLRYQQMKAGGYGTIRVPEESSLGSGPEESTPLLS
ncbi:unnamed protein product [Darwinula stevensoni]|uniref:Solute carrier family 40 member n=1 Tax=Darwinula stevensoni TaxID=69355 RepID=A0A7R8XDD9_9CRUS|nr:unnamed protein product [Darwinula stevensoni]CAG0892948.1 unnamed protein product [Darwinula stevensoni]